MMSIDESVTGGRHKGDQEAQRAYWSRSLEDAYGFMMRAQRFRPVESGEPLESLRDAVSQAGVEVLFNEKPFAATMSRLFYLRRSLIPHFLAAADEMNKRGWVLKVQDAYRTPEMQKALQRTPQLFDRLLKTLLWEVGGEMPDADFVFRRLSGMIAFCPATGTHISGSALDISVFERDTGREVDRGGKCGAFNVVTPMNSPYVTAEDRRNRQAITEIMSRHGFVAISGNSGTTTSRMFTTRFSARIRRWHGMARSGLIPKRGR